jgi:hypothetical protein
MIFVYLPKASLDIDPVTIFAATLSLIKAAKSQKRLVKGRALRTIGSFGTCAVPAALPPSATKSEAAKLHNWTNYINLL